MKPAAPLLSLALLALCLGSALANDLQVRVKVYNCKNEPMSGVTVRISGCVDDGMMGRGTIGISATTDVTGVAKFLEHAENSIQYCWGSALNKCKIEVVGGAGSLTYATLGLVNGNSQLVSPRDWLCQMQGCCKPCAPNNAQEASCTKFIDYGLLEFRPTGGCPRSCCADACTVEVKVNGQDKTAVGTCAGHFAELNSRRRALLQTTDDVTPVTAVTNDDGLVTAVPDEVIFLNEDGTVLKVYNGTDSSTDSTPGRRLLTDDDDECPDGWVSSGKDCSVGGCGKCCIKKVK